MTEENVKTMTVEIFERLGGGEIAYLRPLRSEDVHTLFPQAPQLTPGLELWALLSAEGRPILLTDDKNAAIANARENHLETLSLH